MADTLVDLTVAYQDELNRIAEYGGGVAREVFLDLPSIDRYIINEFIDQLGPTLRAMQEEAHDLTSAWLHEVSGEQPPIIDLTTPVPKWNHPFLRSWRELKKGVDYDQARLSGASQAEAVVIDSTHDAANRSMGRKGLRTVGYRRVPSPKACEWCQVVATQRYRTAESARFGHHSCKCTVVAIFGHNDPGRTIAKQRLAELRKSGATTRASAARARSRARARMA